MSSCSKSSNWSDKFIGAYVGDETCQVGTDHYTVTLAATSTPDMSITLTNVYNQGFTGTCTKTGDQTFSFSGSGGTGSTTTFSGNGTLNGNQLTIAYTISNTATTNACTFVGNK
jgi:hypothetical protein